VDIDKETTIKNRNCKDGIFRDTAEYVKRKN
jgi:hypothetical protein